MPEVKHKVAVPSPDDIKNLRMLLGMSQARFAEVIGLAGDRILRSWENGHRRPSGTASFAINALIDGYRPDSVTSWQHGTAD